MTTDVVKTLDELDKGFKDEFVKISLFMLMMVCYWPVVLRKQRGSYEKVRSGNTD